MAGTVTFAKSPAKILIASDNILIRATLLRAVEIWILKRAIAAKLEKIFRVKSLAD